MDRQKESLQERIKILKKLKKIIIDYEDDIYKALYIDLGKSREEAWLTEYQIVIKEIDYFIANLKDLMKPKEIKTPLHAWKSKAYIYPQAYGHLLLIAPWNYPFQLVFLPLAGALAAGNRVAVKPSEFSEKTSRLIAKLIDQAFSKDQVTCHLGGPEVAQALLKEKFDYIFFTGSPSIGKLVMKAAAENLTPLTLELGGKSPAIVTGKADVKIAARKIVWGKFTNAGQTCIAPDYILVDRRVKKELIKELKKNIEKFYGKDPFKSKDYGRIISPRHLQRLLNLTGGEKIIYGGQFHEACRYLAPTLIEKNDWTGPLMEEEIFGPLLPIIEFENFKEIIASLQKKEKPLAVYLFTEKEKEADYLINNLSFGGGCINDTLLHLSVEGLPFGGLGQSGIGSYHGAYSFQTFSHMKSILKKEARPDIKLRYPPYEKKMGKLKKLI